jgi:hypothetical protein
LPLLFNFAFKYVRKVLELNETHQFLFYADDANILGENTYTINRNIALLEASKEVGVGTNTSECRTEIIL